jgi:site-specific DNA-cytosine methylase
LDAAVNSPRRRVAHIPRGNPLAHLLGKDLLNRASSRKRHGKGVVSVDYFCGAGGLTAGIERAKERLDIEEQNHYGINHDPFSIQTISSNHFGTFINSSVEPIPIRDIVTEGYVTLFTGASECIMHSTARRSDLPIYDQSRTSAAYMLEAIRDLPPEAIIIENVPEWSRWSRLDPKTMRPAAGYEGEYFEAFCKALRDMGYGVEWKVINSADMGAYTSRRRLFLLALADKQRIIWPAQTHAKTPSKHPGMDLQPWRAARDILDWSDLGEHITERGEGYHAVKSLKRMRSGFTAQDALLAPGYAEAITRVIPIADAFHATRSPKFDVTSEDFKSNPLLKNYAKVPAKKKTVSPFTLSERVFVSNVWRAMYGLPRESVELSPSDRKFIRKIGIEQSRSATRVALATCCGDFDIDASQELIESFLLANRVHAAGHPTSSEPAPCFTSATGGGIAHVRPLIIGQQGGAVASTDAMPIPAIATEAAIAKVEATLVKMNASDTSTYNDAVQSIAKPMQTVVQKTCLGISSPAAPEPMIAALYGEKDGRVRTPQVVSETMGALTTTPRFALIDGSLDKTDVVPEAMLSAYYGAKDDKPRRPLSVDGPLGTQPTENRFALLSATPPEPALSPEAVIVTMNHGGAEDSRATTPGGPIQTLTIRGSNGLAQPFITRHNGFFGEEDRGIEQISAPISSVNAGGLHHSVVSPTQPFLFEQRCPDDKNGIRPIDGTVPVITTISRIGLVNPDVVSEKINKTSLTAGTLQEFRPGSDFASSLRPWIRINGVPYLIGITFRMLKVEELARAMGFITKTRNYVFAGNPTQQVKQIGNAVETTVSEALAFAQLSAVLRRHEQLTDERTQVRAA